MTETKKATKKKSGGLKAWLAAREEESDLYLSLAELLVVVVLALSVAALIILTLIWIFTACDLEMRELRLKESLTTLNDNWKAVLILLVPLFYRAIRRFIARIRKGPWGMEADAEDEAPKEDTPLEENPHAEEET